MGRIEIGDICTFSPNFAETKEDYVSKSLDNRLGCYLLMKLVMDSSTLRTNFCAIFSPLEEIGKCTYQKIIEKERPDYIVFVDLSNIGPYNNISMNKGVSLVYMDELSFYSPTFFRFARELCIIKKIDYQIEISDAGAYQTTGISTKDADILAITVPCSKMHTYQTEVKIRDSEEAYKLLIEILLSSSKDQIL